MNLTIGTRGSALALWQSRHVASAIQAKHPEIKVELLTIKTQGDKILDTPLAKIGTKGLFTKEIEEALLEGKVDLAVHSMKDLPTDLPKGLKLGAVMRREDPRDVFISRNGLRLEELRPGDRIGTSSLRRKAFLLYHFPKLEIISIRGNVDTRLKKIETENLVGIVLAAAGIRRMRFEDRVTSFLEPEFMIPAIGQGALAIEIRENDPSIEAVVEELDHPETTKCINIERAFLKRMGGGCQVPMAAYCVPEKNGIKVVGAVVSPNGSHMVRDSLFSTSDVPSIGTKLADLLIEQGAGTILKSVFLNDWEPGPTTDII